QRVGERQQLHAEADVDALGALGQGAADDQRRADRRMGPEVKLGQPEAIDAEVIGDAGEVEPFAEGVVLRVAFAEVERGEDAELHGFRPPPGASNIFLAGARPYPSTERNYDLGPRVHLRRSVGKPLQSPKAGLASSHGLLVRSALDASDGRPQLAPGPPSATRFYT